MTQRNKTVLIATASIGSGHTQAARAIQAAWNANFPGDATVIVDFMHAENSYLNHLIKETYLRMIEATPIIYDVLYHLTQGLGPASSGQNFYSWLMKKAMQRILTLHQPDVVICTHPFPCAAMAYLKRHRQFSGPLIGVVTDFAVHSAWVYPEVDVYCIAADQLRADLVKQHVSSNKIAVTGIPIHPPLTDRAEFILKQLGLREDLPTVLIMGGGCGIGPVQEIAAELDEVSSPMQIVMLTGNNEELRQQLSRTVAALHHPAAVLGYTLFVRELMSVANLLITKPGALTISEAIAAKLPILLFETIPGQEADNAAFLIRHGAAKRFRRHDPETIERCLADSGERRRLIERMELIARPDSGREAVAVIASRLRYVNRVSGM